MFFLQSFFKDSYSVSLHQHRHEKTAAALCSRRLQVMNNASTYSEPSKRGDCLWPHQMIGCISCEWQTPAYAIFKHSHLTIVFLCGCLKKRVSFAHVNLQTLHSLHWTTYETIIGTLSLFWFSVFSDLDMKKYSCTEPILRRGKGWGGVILF